MGFDRLGKRRASRSQTWASVCIGLFANHEQSGETDQHPDADFEDAR